MARYVVGDPVVLTNTFTVNDVNTDPDTIQLDITDPSGNTDTYTYAAAEITKTATGIYTKTITVDEAGTWQFVWTGTGAAADVSDGTFEVFDTDASDLYAPIALVKSHMNVTDTVDDLTLQVAVEAASRAIDRFCHRRFYQVAETRYYSGTDVTPDGITLRVDDLVSISTSLKTDAGSDGTFETTWTTSDYWLAPYNANTDNRPYTKIERRPDGSYSWPTGRRSIEIQGTFGWPAVPAEITEACVLQASRFHKRAKEAPFGVAGLGFDGSALRLYDKLDADVELLVRPYRKLLVA